MWRGAFVKPLAAVSAALKLSSSTTPGPSQQTNAKTRDRRARCKIGHAQPFGPSDLLLCESAEIVRERRRIRKRVAGLLHCDPDREIGQEYNFSGAPILGEGRHGTVLVGVHRATGKEHAVKKVDLPLFGNDQKMREKAVAQEVAIMCTVCGNPHVVDFIDCFVDAGAAYIVMERGKGDLFEWLEAQTADGQRPNEVDVAGLLRQMALAIQHCHEQGVLYQDVKLENFVIDVNHGGVRLIDFSCSEFLEKVDHKRPQGTTAYLAPEVTYQQKSPAMDVWGLGVSFFVMLTGCSPIFTADHNMTDDTSRALQSCSPAARDLLEKMLIRTPGRRITLPEMLDHPFLKAE